MSELLLLSTTPEVVPGETNREQFGFVNGSQGIYRGQAIAKAKEAVQDLGIVPLTSVRQVGAVNIGSWEMVAGDSIVLPNPRVAGRLIQIETIGNGTDNGGVDTNQGSIQTTFRISNVRDNSARSMINGSTFNLVHAGTSIQIHNVSAHYSVAVTDDKVYFIIYIRNNNTYPAANSIYYHAYYSYVYNIATGAMENVTANQTPFKAFGIGNKLPNKVLVANETYPTTSPFWDKVASEWCMVVPNEGANSVSNVRFNPNTRAYSVTDTGTVEDTNLCISPSVAGISDPATHTGDRSFAIIGTGLGPNESQGALRGADNLAASNITIAVPGGIGGTGRLPLDAWNSITVVTADHNYFVSCDRADILEPGSITSGASDYDEEVKFRNAMANYFGI